MVIYEYHSSMSSLQEDKTHPTIQEGTIYNQDIKDHRNNIIILNLISVWNSIMVIV